MNSTDTILNPTVFIGSFEWREPVTTLTDFLVSIVCFFAFFSFLNYKGNKKHNYLSYQTYFLCFAIGMFSAAWFGHALVAYVGTGFKVIGWTASTIAYLFLGNASLLEIKSITKSSAYSVVRFLFFAQAFTFLFLILFPLTSNFVLAQLSSVCSLILFILPMQIYNFMKTGSKGSMWFFISILGGLAPAMVYNNQLSVSRWLNFHDISHVLVAVNMFVAYIGAKKLARQ